MFFKEMPRVKKKKKSHKAQWILKQRDGRVIQKDSRLLKARADSKRRLLIKKSNSW